MPRFGSSDPGRVLAQQFPALVSVLNGRWNAQQGIIDLDDTLWGTLTAQQQSDVRSWLRASGLAPVDAAGQSGADQAAFTALTNARAAVQSAATVADMKVATVSVVDAILAWMSGRRLT